VGEPLVRPCSHVLRAYWNDIACLLSVVNAIHEALVTRVPITKRFIFIIPCLEILFH